MTTPTDTPNAVVDDSTIARDLHWLRDHLREQLSPERFTRSVASRTDAASIRAWLATAGKVTDADLMSDAEKADVSGNGPD